MSPKLLTLDPIKCPSWTFNVRHARDHVYAKVPEVGSYFHHRFPMPSGCPHRHLFRGYGIGAGAGHVLSRIHWKSLLPSRRMSKVAVLPLSGDWSSPLVKSHNSVADGLGQIVAASDGFQSGRLQVRIVTLFWLNMASLGWQRRLLLVIEDAVSR